MKIERIVKKDLRKIRPLLSGNRFKPYYFLKQVPLGRLAALLEWQLDKISSDRHSFILAARDGRKYCGFIALEKQGWDTSFFGFSCYSIRHFFAREGRGQECAAKAFLLEQALKVCRAEGGRYLNAKVDSQDMAGFSVLRAHGFQVNAAMLQLVYRVARPGGRYRPLCKIRPYKKEDLAALKLIARGSMSFDHFHADPYFPKGAADRLYETLVENCCSGAAADEVFVAVRNGKPVGYVACKFRRDISRILKVRVGYIRHLAVSPAEGFGCGPGLQEAALEWSRGKVDIVESTTTVQNLPILKISLKTGMGVVASDFRLARWFG
ncbi:MAG TPA: hypothetical protein DCL35_01090 [Candidatus Omnitrophica bacterium]|nr:hypothetical protein [Candidatus Omnitrophota bacterium]